jgi:hypothetical protein
MAEKAEVKSGMEAALCTIRMVRRQGDAERVRRIRRMESPQLQDRLIPSAGFLFI